MSTDFFDVTGTTAEDWCKSAQRNFPGVTPEHLPLLGAIGASIKLEANEANTMMRYEVLNPIDEQVIRGVSSIPNGVDIESEDGQGLAIVFILTRVWSHIMSNRKAEGEQQ